MRKIPSPFPLFCALLAIMPPASAADGRIFFTATERDALEQGRPLSPPPAPPAPAPVEIPQRFDGALWRDGRLITIWLDRNASPPTPAIRLADDALVTRHGKTDEPLLPGQALSPQP
ncbi:hypothetical protein FACS1894154_01920 [Betaproteobacteria bacterium]|nr:hypothetical protein AGMMS49543_20550 [Betaproteobacteria bacterium]GHT97786.1 hypothetical protein FACS1894154_01920 [Betaproteobacteria bacterium]GHU17474.1 hypothetical protein AGMMS50243_05770 [Betaproteobacteria bacterium]